MRIAAFLVALSFAFNPIAANGEAWEALYTLERQSDDNYKITRRTLKKA